MSPRSEFPHARRIERSLGSHRLDDVEVETGGPAARTAAERDALAFTAGERVGFRDAPSLRLAAHEAAHVVQQRLGASPVGLGMPGDPLERHAEAVADAVMEGRDAAPILDATPRSGSSPRSKASMVQLQRGRTTFPWVGRIANTWAAALRRTPTKDPGRPHSNTEADLPRGTEVSVIGRRGGWLEVRANVGGVEIEGYVSRELVTFVRASSFELPAVEIRVHIPSVSEAFVMLKRAEIRRIEHGPTFVPSEDEQADLGLAAATLERTGKYRVDPATFQVSFSATPGAKIQVTSIEDFILFVEEVERRYPGAAPREIASEVRQLYFADENWSILVASRGIVEGGTPVDIETEPNAVATAFDMATLAPATGRRIATRAGEVDIGHVMAGIDSALSGFPTTAPDGFVSGEKYAALRTASRGDSRDFTTWAGDLGQAYAEYLVDRFVLENAAARIDDFVAGQAGPDQLLGDVHGYIAVRAWQGVPASASPTGNRLSISNILRDLYLVRAPSRESYLDIMASVAGVAASDFEAHVVDRSRRFAQIWFAKQADSASGWGYVTTIDGWMNQFVLLDADDANRSELRRVVHDFVQTLASKPE